MPAADIVSVNAALKQLDKHYAIEISGLKQSIASLQKRLSGPLRIPQTPKG